MDPTTLRLASTFAIDVVKIANLAQVVNVIAPLLTQGDELLKQSIYYAFKLFSECKHGVALRTSQLGSRYQSSHGSAPSLDCFAVLDDRSLTLFLVNRNHREPMSLAVETLDFQASKITDAVLLHHTDLEAANSFSDQPVMPRRFEDVTLSSAGTETRLPAASLARVRLKT